MVRTTPGKFKTSQDFNIMVEVQFHDHLVRLHDRRRWQMLVAADDSGGFVTSDHPVCLRWCDGQDHGNVSPGFAVPGTEVFFPLSPQLVLRGTLEGEENGIDADRDTVAGINSLLISNIHNQLYAQDALFNYKRGPKEGISSGATLWQDNVFLAAGKPRDEKDRCAAGQIKANAGLFVFVACQGLRSLTENLLQQSDASLRPSADHFRSSLLSKHAKRRLASGGARWQTDQAAALAGSADGDRHRRRLRTGPCRRG